jgi:sugar lactone lactonase YvrE
MRALIALIACVAAALLGGRAQATPKMVFDRSGNLFFADWSNNSILKFAPDGTKSTFADKVSQGVLAIDPGGNLLAAVSDGGGTIYKFAGDTSTTVFATGVGLPFSLATDPRGNLFVFDMNTGSIFKFTPDGSKSTFKEGKKPAGQMFASTLILACDRSGNLFVADEESQTISKFAPDGTRTTFAKKVPANDLATDAAENLFAATFSSNTILEFAPDGRRKAIKTKVTAPEGLAVDAAGNLFVWDGPQQKIDKVTPDGNTSTFAENKPPPAPTETPKSDEERDAAGEDSSTGLPPEYAKEYLVARSTTSPDKKFAVIYPKFSDDVADTENESKNKNYLVALQPFQVLDALPTKFPYFEHQSHGGLGAEWSKDSSVALITLDGKWGPRDVFLVELRDGKLNRITNIARKAHDLLLPNYRKAKAARYNDIFDFIFVEDTSFKLEGTSRVVIDGSVETSPNLMSEDLRSSDRAWRGHVEAVWDITQAKFISKKVSGEIRKKSKEQS